jgi:hypothetical protein
LHAHRMPWFHLLIVPPILLHVLTVTILCCN